MCALYGFTDPRTVRQITGKPKRESEARQHYRHALYQEIDALYREGALPHRKTLEDYLASFATIHRSSAKSISIAYDPAERPVRLEGPILERDFFEPHAGRRAETQSEKPNRDRGSNRRMRDGYPILTPRASDRNPSPFAGDRARAFEKRRRYFAELRDKARRNDHQLREALRKRDAFEAWEMDQERAQRVSEVKLAERLIKTVQSVPTGNLKATARQILMEEAGPIWMQRWMMTLGAIMMAIFLMLGMILNSAQKSKSRIEQRTAELQTLQRQINFEEMTLDNMQSLTMGITFYKTENGMALKLPETLRMRKASADVHFPLTNTNRRNLYMITER